MPADLEIAALPTALPSSMRGTVTVSVDVEDWHQLVTRRFSGMLAECSSNVEQQMERVLDILDERAIRATFFVLGLVAKAKPGLVKLLASRGHEIASHGIGHVPFQHLGRDAVRRELADSRVLLEELTGGAVLGFRAPEFSVTAANQWVLEEVCAAGYRYDSSIYPIAHRRYGIRTFPRAPTRIVFGDGDLWELPIATLPMGRTNIPVGGGGYFRLLPGAALRAAVGRLTASNESVMLYFHPYEFAESPLRLDSSALPAARIARARAHVWLTMQAIGRSRLPARARRAIEGCRTVRAIDLVRALDDAHERNTPTRGHDVRNG